MLNSEPNRLSSGIPGCHQSVSLAASGGNLVYISVMLYNILTLHIGVPELSNMGIHDSVYLFTAYLYNYCRL